MLQENFDLSLYYIFYIHLLSKLFWPFHFTNSLSPFLPINFLILKSLQLFLIKCSGNFFTVEITNDRCHGTVFFTFLVTKTCSDQLGRQFFEKIFLHLDSCTRSLTLNLGCYPLCSIPYSRYISQKYLYASRLICK